MTPPTPASHPRATDPRASTVHRVEVAPRAGAPDPRADALRRNAGSLGIELREARTTDIYLIEAALTDEQLAHIRDELLTDPVLEQTVPGASPAAYGADGSLIEVHPLPGVMDPTAQSVSDAILELTGVEAGVSTGVRYDMAGLNADQAASLAGSLLANGVVQAVHSAPFHPDRLPRGAETQFELRHTEITPLDDEALTRLSRDAHLFLSLEEMRCVRDGYRALGREPTDIELETIAQTWSEHCVHKTLKSRMRYTPPSAGDSIRFEDRPRHTLHDDGTVTIDNLLAATVAAATHELIDEGIDWTLSVFVDNAGIIRFDDKHAVCVKVETHNHPSALEPYGGAATGIGGCIRDIIGTGLAADPIASTDVFCVAHPNSDDVPDGCLPPTRILRRVVDGVRDYGNRMGIPTVNGAVSFDDRYVGNPLVFCGCVGVMPADKIGGDPRPGDKIVALGGRTGRDGIHGATFSSAELTDTHGDEFGHAVQIGNPIEEKRVLDAILRARDAEGGPLFSSITDCGAGGFSSAVGEMGEQLGADVHLDQAPLKYDGLSYTEIWISEAQERMVLAVPADRLDELQTICDEEAVELAVLGTFGTPNRELILNYRGTEVGRLPMALLHDGIPQLTREASWTPATPPATPSPRRESVCDLLKEALAHPDVASKHAIIREYDHEVKGNTVVKPLTGPLGRGPSDAAVVQPVPGSDMGLAIACGLQTGIGDPALGGDPYQMALGGIDECVRNLVCTGARPDRIAILDNFCWPSCNDEESLGTLVRAAEGCYDGAKAYRTPFVSGKDSLNNQFTTESGRTIKIPPTLLISGIGIVDDVRRCVTTDMKDPRSMLLLVGPTTDALAGSVLGDIAGVTDDQNSVPTVDLELGARTAAAVHQLIDSGIVRAAHDVSDGGVACAVAEMLIGAASGDQPIGAQLDLSFHDDPFVAAFSESPSRYVLELDLVKYPKGVILDLRNDGIPCHLLGRTNDSGQLRLDDRSVLEVEELTEIWRDTLSWMDHRAAR